jgi:uncharacterized membrane protein (DUF4010 family)
MRDRLHQFAHVVVTFWDSRATSLTVALAVGLLIGLDREKHKSAGSSSSAAGVRTFTLVALLGAMVALLHSDVMIAVAGGGLVFLTALSYRANQAQYPGLTTEFALLATFAIGFMAVGQVELAAALGVLITLLISSKSRLHTFAVSQLSEQELHDATLLAGAALIVLPLLPNQPIDPLGVVNLRLVWSLTVLMLGINALGYVARRTLGPEVGLAVAGFCGGFVSSILPIAAIGRQAHAQPSLLRSAVAGAAFSSIATVIELLVIIVITNARLLPYLGPGVAAMGMVAAVYGLVFEIAATGPRSPAEPVSGRAFEPKFAILFACAFAFMLLIAALLQRLLGPSGAQATIALGGLIDTHAATASAARLASSGTLGVIPAAFAATLAITANTIVKAIAAVVAGDRAFALRLCPSHLGMIIALWLAWFLVRNIPTP